jgi:hypothetical protein
LLCHNFEILRVNEKCNTPKIEDKTMQNTYYQRVVDALHRITPHCIDNRSAMRDNSGKTDGDGIRKRREGMDERSGAGGLWRVRTARPPP